MDAATLATALTSLGVVFGWQAMPDDPQNDAPPRYEAIVQLDPELAQLVARGDSVPVVVEVPADVQPIGRIRIVVGQGMPPRQRLVTAMKPLADESGEAIRLTQYNQPLAPASQPSRYGAAPTANFDPYAKPVAPATAGAGTATAAPATVANPWTQPYQQAVPDVRQAYQQAQQQGLAQADAWARQQAAQFQGQVNNAANDALQRAQQTMGQAQPSQPGPTIEQLFGNGAAPAAQQPSPPAWNQDAVADGTRPLERVGAGIQRAFDPLRDGVDRIDNRLRNAADNVSDRTRQLFDHLGRPIQSVADRQRSILAGRNATREPVPPVTSGAPAPARSATGSYTPTNNPFDPYTGAPRYNSTGNGPSGDYRAAESTPDPRESAFGANRRQDDRDWQSTRSSERPWPEIPQQRLDRSGAGDALAGSRWDLAARDPSGGAAAADPSRRAEDRSWSDRGPQFSGNEGSPVTPTIERRMLAAPASAPVEAVADGLLRFPSDPVGLDLSGGATPGLDPEVTASPFAQAGGQRPPAADLGWGENGAAPATTPQPQPTSPQPGEPRVAEQQTASTAQDDPTSPLGLLLAWLLLSGSIAGNVYLFWSYLDVRNKYSSLIRKSARSVGSRFATA